MNEEEVKEIYNNLLDLWRKNKYNYSEIPMISIQIDNDISHKERKEIIKIYSKVSKIIKLKHKVKIIIQ